MAGAVVDSDSRLELTDQEFISFIYDIALDPGNLDEFIDRLESETQHESRDATEQVRIQTLSGLLESHLSRAEVFLDRVVEKEHSSATQRALAPFDSTPAFIINAAFDVVEINQPAASAYSITIGDSLDALPFAEEDVDDLFATLRRVLRDRSGKGVLLSLRPRSSGTVQQPTALLHAHRLDIQSGNSVEVGGRSGFALLVSTDVRWPLALDQTLHEVFSLTATERGILRSLVEGSSLKQIAEGRNRSLATVRTQVKSVLEKTRTHSQSELIRVTLSLMGIIRHSPLSGSAMPASNETTDADPPLQKAEYKSINVVGDRRLDYLVQGDPEGQPIIFSHMGYGLVRWPPAALELALEYRLKIITPVRSGYGNSDAIDKSADIAEVTRNDTLAIMDHLGVDTCTYVSQGNDLIFAMDLVSHHPKRIKQLIGLGPRLPLPSEIQYKGMGRWHRFLLSTARHAPHLLFFAAKAAFTLAQKIGPDQMFRNVHRNSLADLACTQDPELRPTLLENSSISVDTHKHAAFAYAKELFATEDDWSNLVRQTRKTPAWYISGVEDPLGDPATIAAYREAFPWIQIDVVKDAGQLLFFSKFRQLIPRIAELAHQQ